MIQEAKVYDINMIYIKNTRFYQLYNAYNSNVNPFSNDPWFEPTTSTLKREALHPMLDCFNAWLFYFNSFSWFLTCIKVQEFSHNVGLWPLGALLLGLPFGPHLLPFASTKSHFSLYSFSTLINWDIHIFYLQIIYLIDNLVCVFMSVSSI